MKISQEDVLQFKHRYSDENKIIASIIRERLYDEFEEIIVDVGAGIGDITSIALPSKKVVQVEILDYAEFFLSERHSRYVIDFFDYVPEKGERIGTLLFSHVLQFLDRDTLRLNNKVRELSPGKVITVTNVNDGFMGDVVKWVTQHFEYANPEVDLPDFPTGYELKDEVRFKGHVTCRDFRSLGKQVGYLMDTQLSSVEEESLERFLRENLGQPTFSINQRIRVYNRA